MFDRSNSRNQTSRQEYVSDFEPEKSEYSEYRMNARRDPDDTSRETDLGALFSDDQARELRHDWENVQAGFVDDPRQAVKDADQLVDRTIQQISDTFARQRGNLEQQWDSGGEVSTEELRVVLQRYRAFFNRLLSV